MLLTGPPASAKNMMMKIIEGHGGKQRVYFADGGATMEAGLFNFISNNPSKEIIIIDEIDKMKKEDRQGLLTLTERGESIKVPKYTKQEQ